jgi:acyl-CoA synthetase (AMP-forming)/AMP-acid ligase II
MHGTAHWMAFQALFTGGTVVIDAARSMDPAGIWRLVAREQVNFLVIVGDAMGRPLVEALDDLDASVDVSCLTLLLSGGAILSPAVKRQLARAGDPLAASPAAERRAKREQRMPTRKLTRVTRQESHVSEALLHASKALTTFAPRKRIELQFRMSTPVVQLMNSKLTELSTGQKLAPSLRRIAMCQSSTTGEASGLAAKTIPLFATIGGNGMTAVGGTATMRALFL